MAQSRVALVDSSAWIEFLRATGSPADEWLTRLFKGGGAPATTEPVQMELLAGAPQPTGRARVRRILAACRMLSVNNASDWDRAADLYLACRGAGATPRRMLDCLIAAVAIRVDLPVLAQDRDFELIAEHTQLQLAS